MTKFFHSHNVNFLLLHEDKEWLIQNESLVLLEWDELRLGNSDAITEAQPGNLETPPENSVPAPPSPGPAPEPVTLPNICLRTVSFVLGSQTPCCTQGIHLIHEHSQYQNPLSDWLFTKFNRILLKFYDVSSGRDLKTFILAIAFLWILSGIGNYFSSLNLLYTGFLCLITLPALYERYQDEVDYLAGKGNRNMKKLYKKLDSKFLNKIPRGPVKEKKKF
ncbi:UNVERIFIED_CONTAM: Reticulon-like protein B14 [Sesamum latifolium]|uniref:Reticulon-like protein n=1 Tax=Sesamum latifolium TaxID=2727402 RepID=A0AAW2X436_9LAMI